MSHERALDTEPAVPDTDSPAALRGRYVGFSARATVSFYMYSFKVATQSSRGLLA
ncbi:hypothetical protein [Paraburkholderia domus]|uniref:hypothetical protein n=1 Tax=Paraburkholderia domus TaxID=2793075 RepID=UPI001913D8E7|nr:hypothetical protein [Paraburkholderia domus]MBK5164796.1 hypothetical protein [Burkholderia sp. R-70211]